MNLTYGCVLGLMGAILVGSPCRSQSTSQPRPALQTVENPRPSKALPTWRLPVNSPLLTLGRGPGDDDLFDNTVARFAWMGDSNVVVLGGQTWVVRIFAPNGTLLQHFGRGRGPKEFGESQFVLPLTGNRVAVGNFRQGPLRIIGRDLNIVETVPLKPTMFGRAEPGERMSDGRWLATGGTVRNAITGKPEELVAAWGFLDKEFANLKIIGYYTPEPPSGTFGPMLFTKVHAGHLYLVTNGRPEVEIRDTLDRIVKRIHIDLPSEPVTRRARETSIDGSVARLRSHGGTEAQAMQFREDLEHAKFAPTFRYFDNILISSDGWIWLQQLRRADGDSVRYLILNPEGKLVAQATLPPSTELFAVRRDAILIANRDEEDGLLVYVVPIRRR